MNSKVDKYEKVFKLAKSRGFFWEAFEIYGGVGGFLDFGPLGVLLKRRISDMWIKWFVKNEGFVEVETPIVNPEVVFKASGHIDSFKEPAFKCLKCDRRFRADHLVEEALGLSSIEVENMDLKTLQKLVSDKGLKCPECGGELGEPYYFTTMFKTFIGPYMENVGYGRPEAAQGMFLAFKRALELKRRKLPFAIAQVGKVLRNEISPRQGPIRLREFTIMELELFIDPEDPKCLEINKVENEVLRIIPAEARIKGCEEPLELTVREYLDKGLISMEWLAYFMVKAKQFMEHLGIPHDRQRFVEKLPWERAHYSSQGFDQEIYLDRWGWVEVSGHNYRTDYDLKRHMDYSGVDMTVYKQFEKPINMKKIQVEPVYETIRRDFREQSDTVVKLIMSIKPETLADGLINNNAVKLGDYLIKPEHVKISECIVEEKGKRFIPHVIEPSFGLERAFYAVLEYAYTEREGRAILKLPIAVAPILIAVYPLVTKDGIPEKALEVYTRLLNSGFDVYYDDSGSIGRRYVRSDEMGIPLALTVDYQTLQDNTVTLRNRDDWRQVRTNLDSIENRLKSFLTGEISFENLGEPI
ncbi:glycine--tRNA ligase [Candidatus Bathyarchaeota archaeon]|nr:glycine--tRNA ligase [Candidatus Bathyarchaeota archaeon]